MFNELMSGKSDGLQRNSGRLQGSVNQVLI